MAVSDSWIKVRGCLLRHPKVAAMTGHLLSDREFRAWLMPDEGSGMDGGAVSKSGRIAVTVGLLVAVWSAAREYGEFEGDDLRLPHNTLDDLDVLAGAPGVGKAMKAVGWAEGEDDEEGVTLPEFKTYNVPKSAAERASEYRGNRKGTSASASRHENVTESSRERHDLPLSLSLSESSQEGESERKPKAVKPTHSRAYTPQFEEAWQLFPSVGRDKKPLAFKAYLSAAARLVGSGACPDNTAAFVKIKALVVAYASSPKGRSQFAGHMASWLNGDPWTSGVDAWQRGDDPRQSAKVEATAKAAADADLYRAWESLPESERRAVFEEAERRFANSTVSKRDRIVSVMRKRGAA